MENLLNSISKMLDEKLKPIQEQMNRLENKVDVLEQDISTLKQVQERIEKKLDVNVNIFLYKKWKIIMYNN